MMLSVTVVAPTQTEEQPSSWNSWELPEAKQFAQGHAGRAKDGHEVPLPSAVGQGKAGPLLSHAPRLCPLTTHPYSSRG